MAVVTRSSNHARAILLAAFGAMPSISFATDYTWNASAGGTFATTTNWIPASPAGGPGVADRAIFNLNNTYPVTFSATVFNTAFRQSQGNVAFDIGSGRSYTVTAFNAFELGNTAGQTANLTVNSGSLILSQSNSTVGLVSGGTGTLTIQNVGTSFVTGSNYCDFGVAGTGSLIIQNGATASIGGASYLGLNSGSNGRLQIYNSGTTATFGGGFIVGNSGTGLVEVDQGATTTFGLNLIIGNNPGSIGTFRIGVVTGGNTANTSGFTLGNFSGSSGTMTISSTLNNCWRRQHCSIGRCNRYGSTQRRRLESVRRLDLRRWQQRRGRR